ncbi:hypothetical protein CDEF62S_03604 [Castellaniella defragrans]
MFEEIDAGSHQFTLLNPPVRYDGEKLPTRRFALAPGADSRAVLSELGFASERIDQLVARGVVAAPENASIHFQSDSPRDTQSNE